MYRRQIIVRIIVVIMWGLIGTMLFNAKSRSITLELTVQAYKDRFAQRLGDDDTYGVYRLLTMDGGLTWWEFETNELPGGSAVMIVGRADAGLVHRLNKRDEDER